MSSAQTKIEICYPTRRSVLASYKLDGATLSLFVPTNVDISVGTEVQIEVGFGDSSQRFSLNGRVTWRRPQARGMRLEPGLGIAFTGGAKYAPAQMLAFCAGRSLELGTAQDARVQASIPCQVESGKRRVRARVRDISSSGAFISASDIAAFVPGQELALTLEPGWFGWGGKTIRAKVVWSGDKLGMPGFGARFLGVPADIKPAVRKYLGRRP